MTFVSTLRIPTLLTAIAAILLGTSTASRAAGESMLLVEADTGRVLHAENATHPWYPASVTKVMTAYVTLQAVKSGQLSIDSLLTVSERAALQQPSKIGFKPGTQVTVDNAIKMLMVKSANDMAVVLAEGVAGSVENFAAQMNATSERLGMTQSNWVNPNGLPDDEQISSARDLAILARAMLRDFPEYHLYWNIGAIKLGKRTMRNTNSLIGRYPGADGMKTGFICSSGFNLVASASRNGKRLIAVVLGSPSSPVRGAKAAGLLERGFNGNGRTWLAAHGTVDALQPINAAPPDMREAMCGKHRKRPAAEEADEEPAPSAATQADSNSPQAFMLSSLPPAPGKISTLLGPVPAVNPIVVYAGPAKKLVEPQIAAARTKLDAAAKKNARNAKSGQIAPVTAALAATAPAPAAPGQIAAAPAAQFAPPPGQFTRTPAGRMPGASDAPAAWMSFAPPANAAPAALTAMPSAARQAAVPMPRPRPKATAKPR